MSEFLTLSLRAPLDESIEVEDVTPDRLAALGERDILSLPVFAGSRAASLGDFFTLTGGPSSRVRVVGALDRVDGLGARMTGGELILDGNAGHRVGARMAGGWIEVKGRVGDDAGQAMAGGVLRIQGDAGDRLGAAAPGASKGMTGGEVLVNGSAGAGVGSRARRGLIVVAGDTGEDAAHAMIAGTLVVFGRTGANPGRGSKRGSVVACGSISVPQTYAYACTFQPAYVRLLMTHLRRRYGMDIDRRYLDGRYRRYCGDAGEPGKGEILEFVEQPGRSASKG